MHTEHGVGCKALPREPSTRQMEHFLHQSQPPEACAKVIPSPVVWLISSVVLLFVSVLIYYTEVCCWLRYVPPLS